MARKKKVSPGNRLVAYYRYSGGSQQTEQSIEGQRLHLVFAHGPSFRGSSDKHFLIFGHKIDF